MPYAKRRQTADLNRAYAFLSEPSFGAAARALADKLVDMGFEEDEALDNIEPVERTLDFQKDLFGPQEKPEPVFKYATPAPPEILSELRGSAHDGMLVRETAEGQVEIALTGWINQDREQAIAEALPEQERKSFATAVTQYRAAVKEQISPAEQEQPFKNKIAAIRQQERSSVYQQYLLAPQANTTVSFDTAFTFVDTMYWDQRRYRGHWKPSKHFLGPDRVPAFDGADDGEEMQCAQVIDSLTAMKYWIRNVACHPNSFWLPTATDKFYPDFVALLNDDRLLVVEYKGAHIAEGTDTNEKRTIGALWEKSSDGKGLFLIAEQKVDGKDVRQQLVEKIGT